ncbi:tail fiber domain-containing protein [Emticicia sp.]|uniref:tail fiber domain-containing protein n=1 Tax=Emticicia sp. TaxID=1930953 RepID=UPI0037538A35
MKKVFISLLFFMILNNAFGQSSILIEPNGNNGILSKNATTISAEPAAIALPVSGAGTRFMWIPAKSAFRVGTVDGNTWDASYVGTWSFASGYNTTASGVRSTAMGYFTTASGDVSTAMGLYTRASGLVSTAMGFSNTASGLISTAMGDYTTASGNYSTAMGNSTTASGNYSTAMGNSTTASALYSTTFGTYNIIQGTPGSFVPTEPLFVIGNGLGDGDRNNALTLLKNANLGINTSTPQYPLTFTNTVGDKISLWGGNTNNTTNHFGLGIQNNQLQIYTPSSADNIVFGTGRSAAFNEKVRFNGNGKVGIGINDPYQILDINGRVRIRNNGETSGIWMTNSSHNLSDATGAFYGLFSDTEAGIFIGNSWRFLINNSGNVTIGGTVTASCGLLVCSDLRYKKNITSLNNSLSNLLKINGVRYNYRQNEFPDKNFSNNNQIGFIAQDIEKVFPEIVFTDEKGYKSVDYSRLTPVLVEALKEQNKRIDYLEKELAEIKSLLKNSLNIEAKNAK